MNPFHASDSYQKIKPSPETLLPPADFFYFTNQKSITWPPLVTKLNWKNKYLANGNGITMASFNIHYVFVLWDWAHCLDKIRILLARNIGRMSVDQATKSVFYNNARKMSRTEGYRFPD